jgi:hypothetical protein
MATEGHIALTNRALRTIRTVSHGPFQARLMTVY